MKKILFYFSFVFLFVLAVPAFALAFNAQCVGGDVVREGNTVVHTFTGSGSLNCSGAGGGEVEVLVVGGGGGGGGGAGFSGGGGAGGYVYENSHTLNAQSYSVVVGAKGIGDGRGAPTYGGSSGGDSIFDNITAYGGGGGGSTEGDAALSGGSGGGRGNFGLSGTGVPGQGYDGGSGVGGGGGGAAGPGQDNSGLGGPGVENSISGTPVVYSKGGDGRPLGAHGVNPGDGGGGDSHNGSDGIVIVKYTITTPIYGSGSANRIPKFISSNSLSNSLLSDDGSNLTLNLGNLFLPAGSLVDTSVTGQLNFGTQNSNKMVFGKLGSKMIINSSVGVLTDNPVATLTVNGDLSASHIKILADEEGLDTLSAGLLKLGTTNASAVVVGKSGVVVSHPGGVISKAYSTETNCASSASPAICGSAAAGSVALTGRTLVVNTSAVSDSSQILITEDSSLSSRLGVTCNSNLGRTYMVTVRTPGVGFTVKSSNSLGSDRACLNYLVIN